MPEASDETIEAFKAELVETPRPVTRAITWAQEELGIKQHVARTFIDRWVEKGIIDERREHDGGPGRPRRVVGGKPT